MYYLILNVCLTKRVAISKKNETKTNILIIFLILFKTVPKTSSQSSELNFFFRLFLSTKFISSEISLIIF